MNDWHEEYVTARIKDRKDTWLRAGIWIAVVMTFLAQSATLIGWLISVCR